MSQRKKCKKKRKAVSPAALPMIRPNVAGIDLHSTKHVVCGPVAKEGDKPNVRIFGTTTPQLCALVDWLEGQGIESVAMESTHVYWIPLYELLESRGIEVLLVNARFLHNVPGRKSDMIDSQWIQLLHSCGLLRGSFRPHESICRLRAMQRQLANLVTQRTRIIQWMQQALDQMNVQVHRAVTDITGKTGMGILRAIVSGVRDPAELAELRDPRCRKTNKEFAEHLTGTWRDEHLFNLELSLQLYDQIQAAIQSYEDRILQEVKALQPQERRSESVPVHPNPAKQRAIVKNGDQEARTELWRMAGIDLTRIDGIGLSAAQVILAEVGLNLGAFPSEKNFISWLRLAPNTRFSAGKPKKKKRNPLGANRIAAVLRMGATSLRSSKTALGASYRRIARHKGQGVAVFATARKLAQLVYRMLRYGQDYTDIGAEAYESRFREKRLAGLRSAAKDLGYDLVAPASTT